MKDEIKPDHYEINLLKIGNELKLDPYRFSCFKYIARAGKKSKEPFHKDIQKAIRCLEMLLEDYPEQKETQSLGVLNNLPPVYDYQYIPDKLTKNDNL